MTEILNIIFIISAILWIVHFPILKTQFTLVNKNFYISRSVKISINLGIFVNLLLLLSFTNISQKIIFIILILLPFINILYLKKKKLLNELIILFLFVFIISLSVGSNLILEWDAAEVWIYKVLNFYNSKSFLNLSNMPGDASYPYLGTYIWSFFWKNSFIDSEYVGRIFYVFYYCLSIFLIASSEKKNLNKCICTTLFMFLTLDYYILSGYQEILVFSSLIFIFYFFDKYLEKKEIFYLFPIILFANASIWFKNEALFFVLFFFIYAFIKSFTKKEKVEGIFFILILTFSILVITKYFIFYNYLNVINTGWFNYQITEVEEILKVDYIISRTLDIFIAIIVALIKCKTYILFFATIVIFNFKDNFKVVFPYLVYLSCNIFLIFLIYFFTNDPSYQHYLATTVDRLFIQTSGIYLIPIYYILKKYINNNRLF